MLTDAFFTDPKLHALNAIAGSTVLWSLMGQAQILFGTLASLAAVILYTIQLVHWVRKLRDKNDGNDHKSS